MMEMNFAGWASFMAPLAMNNPDPMLTKQLERSFISADPIIAREFAEVTFFRIIEKICLKRQCLHSYCNARMIVSFL